MDAFRPGLSRKLPFIHLHRVKGPDITQTIVKSKSRWFGWHPDCAGFRINI